MSKEILIKGWSPAPSEANATKQPPPKKPSSSKGELKRRLKKASAEIDGDEPDEKAITQLLEEASSQSDDNGDMLKLKGLAQAYMDPYDDES